MSDNDEIKIFIKWTAPTALVLSPLLFVIVLVKFFREQKVGAPLDPLDPNLLIITAFCIFSFLTAIYFCRKDLGWFGGKKQD